MLYGADEMKKFQHELEKSLITWYKSKYKFGVLPKYGIQYTGSKERPCLSDLRFTLCMTKSICLKHQTSYFGSIPTSTFLLACECRRLFLPSLPPAESRRHLLSTGGSAGRNRHLQATLLFVFYFKFHSKFYYKVAATGLTLLARTYTSIYFSMDLLRFSARESQGWMLLKTTSIYY